MNEGYGTCDMFAPEDAYASSKERAVAELLQLVDEAHRHGLAVIFDVVYSHGATDDNRYWRYDGNCRGSSTGGDYFEDGHDTKFGAGFAMWKKEVKDFFLDNARTFLRDYRVDGLRFDAVQFIQEDAVQAIVWALRSEFPDKYLIAEYNPSDSQSAGSAVDPFNTLGFCATWDLASPAQTYKALSEDASVDNLLALIGGFGTPNPWCTLRYPTGSHDNVNRDKPENLDKGYIVERFGGRWDGWPGRRLGLHGLWRSPSPARR